MIAQTTGGLVAGFVGRITELSFAARTTAAEEPFFFAVAKPVIESPRAGANADDGDQQNRHTDHGITSEVCFAKNSAASWSRAIEPASHSWLPK
jgi:hypothetical protein